MAVTKITAKDDTAKAKKAQPKAATPAKVVKAAKETNAPKAPKASKAKREKKNVFARIGGYFKGAWKELRQVRWPNRRATWSLTLAVIVFSIFFVLLILLLDTLFKFLFELIIT